VVLLAAALVPLLTPSDRWSLDAWRTR